MMREALIEKATMAIKVADSGFEGDDTKTYPEEDARWLRVWASPQRRSRRESRGRTDGLQHNRATGAIMSAGNVEGGRQSNG